MKRVNTKKQGSTFKSTRTSVVLSIVQQDQLTDLFTKVVKRSRFLKLRRETKVVNFGSLN